MEKNIKVVNSNNEGWEELVNSTTYDYQTIMFEDLGITFDFDKNK